MTIEKIFEFILIELWWSSLFICGIFENLYFKLGKRQDFNQQLFRSVSCVCFTIFVEESAKMESNTVIYKLQNDARVEVNNTYLSDSEAEYLLDKVSSLPFNSSLSSSSLKSDNVMQIWYGPGPYCFGGYEHMQSSNARFLA